MGNIADEITNMANIADEITNSLAEESKFFAKNDGWPLHMEGGEDEDEEALASRWDESDDEELAYEYARDDDIYEKALAAEEDRLVEDLWSSHVEEVAW